jgi:DNA repair protein RecO
MKVESDLGIVLKKTIYQDTKLIVNVFTKAKGLITLNVQFSQKTAHRLGVFEIGNILNLELIAYKNYYRVHDSFIEYSPLSLRKNLDLLVLWARFLSNLQNTLPDQGPDPKCFELVYLGIKHLDTHPYPKDLSYFIFLKWLQNEGVLSFNGLDSEKDYLLKIKKLSELVPLSNNLIQEIETGLLNYQS